MEKGKQNGLTLQIPKIMYYLQITVIIVYFISDDSAYR